MDEDEDVVESGAGGLRQGTQCEHCGATTFVLEGGFYFCTICHVQSQDAREYVEREEWSQGPQRSSRVATLKEAKKGSQNPTPKIQIDHYEVYNCVMSELTDKLMRHGFPETLREKIFSIWTDYLVRRQAIFVPKAKSDHDSLKTGNWNRGHGKFCGCADRRKTNVRGLTRRAKLAKARANIKAQQAFILEDEDDDNPSVSLSIKKRRKTLAKRKAMESHFASQLEQSRLEEDPTSSTANAKPSKLKPCRLTKETRLLTKLSKIHGPGRGLQTVMRRVENCSYRVLLSIIFIAMRQIGYSVLVSDVLRLLWDGTLYMSSIRPLLGEKAVEMSELPLDSHRKSFCLETGYAEGIQDLIDYVGIVDFNFPSLVECLPKILDDFVLPRELECFILQMQAVLSVTSDTFFEKAKTHNGTHDKEMLKQYKILVEYLVVAVIIYTLRLLFSMDDVTERYQSTFAKTVNSILIRNQNESASAESDWVKLFVMEDWFPYLRRRKRIFEKEQFNPAYYKPFQALTSVTAAHLIRQHGGQKGKVLRSAYQESSRNEVEKMFRSYNSSSAESQPPLYCSISLPQEDLVDVYKESHPNVKNPQFSPEQFNHEDFTKHRIDFIWNPEKYVKLLRLSGYKVRVLPGDARCYENLEELAKGRILLFQPFRKFDEHYTKGFSRSHSLKFLITMWSQILGGNPLSEDTNKLDFLGDILENYYACHLKYGVLNIYPYSFGDADAETDESSSSDE